MGHPLECVTPADYDRLVAELDRLRMENHRLTELVHNADLVHIRLRAGLREACDGWERENDPADGDVLPSIGETARKIAELRKLLGPEGA